MSSFVKSRHSLKEEAALYMKTDPDIFLQNGYGILFKKYRWLSQSILEKWQNLFLKILALISSDQPIILDVGAGVGRFSFPLATLKLPVPPLVFAIDRSSEMLSVLKEQSSKNGFSNIFFIESDILKYDNKKAFDFIFLSDILPFLIPIERTFLHLNSLLRDKGFICIRARSHANLAQIEWLHDFPKLLELDRARVPDIGELVDMITRCGFNNIILQEIDETENIPCDIYIKMLKDRSFSILHCLSDKDFDNGLISVKKRLTNKKSTLQTSISTAIIARKETFNAPI